MPGKRKEPPKTTNELLDRFKKASVDKERVSLGDLLDAVGKRSFGPLLLFAGIIMSAPGISDIPSVPTTVGIFVLIVSGQILFGRDHFWLPGWLLRRSVSSKRLLKLAASKWVRRPAAWVDKFVTERLRIFAGPKSSYIVALITTILALIAPITELVPLSGVGVGAAILCFGISLIAHDGLMNLIGLAISVITTTLAISVAL